MAMELAMELELEDDVFFADISKQISLLIMDEDDEQDPVSVCSSVSFQGLLGGNYQTASAGVGVSPYAYEQSCRTRESKGTGVFIPRSSSQPRRKQHSQKQGRFSSFNPKPQSHQQRQFQQQHDNSRTLVYNSNSTVHASNPRKTYRDSASIST
ncbi:PREDICTED: uncharacterized protein LOC104818805 [Tarenaya hassleriana]|uniref:uncharacterized protein LOC104818805 n=1 Tax=Tarenaya hassleriana TaxID=28532 RepID=UPI00053C48B1|nr:PREDICTED: uncharacterized protein LOC104818805 [Tarenaya hassleriana]